MTPDGMILLPSSHDANATMDRLVASVTAHGLHVFARIDHAGAAQQAGLTLRPTEVLIFGDPKGGTLLMQAAQSIGIDLPLKVLVWEDEAGKCWIGYNDPHWLAARHGVMQGHEKLLDAMTKGLETVTKEAC
jgi:uncharacterized protein (DUF302 family)